MRRLIKGGYVIDPLNHVEGFMNVFIENGKISGLKTALEQVDESEYDVIDASGLVVAPGFIDLHVHLREPGFEHKETIKSGTAACAKGGYTTVACMPNTKPALDTKERILSLKAIIEKDACIEVIPVGAITMGIAGETLTEHNQLFEAGVIGLSDDGRTTMDAQLMKMAFLNAKVYNKPIMTHSEDHALTCHYKTEVYPISAETDIVARDIKLCEETNGHLHVGHVSGAEAIEAIRNAKKNGVHVTCEAAPHHFALNDERVNPLETKSKVNPPIRSEQHRRAVIEGLKDGTIDIIATDHAPHDAKSKEVTYENAAFGISGIESAFSVAYSILVLEEGLPLSTLIYKMATRPAQIMGLNDVGNLSIGSKANVVLLNINQRTVIDASTFVSKGKNTPFDGMKVQGEVMETIYQGVTVYKRD